jgi:hypothetical protein
LLASLLCNIRFVAAVCNVPVLSKYVAVDARVKVMRGSNDPGVRNDRSSVAPAGSAEPGDQALPVQLNTATPCSTPYGVGTLGPACAAGCHAEPSQLNAATPRRAPLGVEGVAVPPAGVHADPDHV